MAFLRKLRCLLLGHGPPYIHTEWVKLKIPVSDGGVLHEFTLKEDLVCSKCGTIFEEGDNIWEREKVQCQDL